jgi:prepilin-type N-terminal cleavage/methylation domain-containing protein/prepilin-type processing-associated H-X9-DG protein
MRITRPGKNAFTLTELLVTIAVIAILAALLLPVLSRAKARAHQTTCLNNLKQINLAFQLYAGDNGDTLPAAPNTVAYTAFVTNHFAIFYKGLVKGYVGLRGASSPQDKLFACPADNFYFDGAYDETTSYHESSNIDYSSYAYNGLGGTVNAPPTLPDQTQFPGLFGRKLASIKESAKTVVVDEFSAFWPFSWHETQVPPPGQDGNNGFNNAKSEVSFADGHVSYIPIYFDTSYNDIPTAYYNPPAGYDYKWSAD